MPEAHQDRITHRVQEIGKAWDFDAAGNERIDRVGQIEHVKGVDSFKRDQVGAIANEPYPVQVFVRLAQFIGPRFVWELGNELENRFVLCRAQYIEGVV